MSKIQPQVIIEGHDLFAEFNGALTENYAAQELMPLYKELYYWTSEGTAEVDFVVAYNSQIYPLEVKAGVSRRKKSLLSYDNKYAPALLGRSSLMNLAKNGKIANYPLYLIHRFPTLAG